MTIVLWNKLHYFETGLNKIRHVQIADVKCQENKNSVILILTFTIICANPAEDKFIFVFWFFPENILWYFMQSIS